MIDWNEWERVRKLSPDAFWRDMEQKVYAEQRSGEMIKRLPPPSTEARDWLRRAQSNPAWRRLLERLRERDKMMADSKCWDCDETVPDGRFWCDECLAAYRQRVYACEVCGQEVEPDGHCAWCAGRALALDMLIGE